MTDRAEIPTIKAVRKCAHVLSLSTDPRQAGQSRFMSVLQTNLSIAQNAMRALEAAWQRDSEIHAENETAIATNRLVRERIAALMSSIGMPEKFRRPKPGSRSYPPKQETVEAGYLTDLAREVPIDDGFARAQARYTESKARFQKFLDDAEQEAERRRLEAARAEERRREDLRANVDLAQIKMRYDLRAELDWSEVLEELRKRDQRLDLAVAMQQTRGDWSEGFYRVSAALERFTINDTTDKDIAACVVSNMDCDDGRVFRDCEWNYGRLFAEAADPQLSSDILTCLSHVDDAP